jgi:hypothetical protein
MHLYCTIFTSIPDSVLIPRALLQGFEGEIGVFSLGSEFLVHFDPQGVLCVYLGSRGVMGLRRASLVCLINGAKKRWESDFL